MKNENESVAPSASKAFATAEDECLQVALALSDAGRLAAASAGGPRRRAALLRHAARIGQGAALRLELLLLDVRYGLQVIEAERNIDDFASRGNRRRDSRAA